MLWFLSHPTDHLFGKSRRIKKSESGGPSEPRFKMTKRNGSATIRRGSHILLHFRPHLQEGLREAKQLLPLSCQPPLRDAQDSGSCSFNHKDLRSFQSRVADQTNIGLTWQQKMQNATISFERLHHLSRKRIDALSCARGERLTAT